MCQAKPVKFCNDFTQLGLPVLILRGSQSLDKMKISVDRLKVGDEVAYGSFTNFYTGRNRPDFTFSKVAKINSKSVTLENGQVIFFNGTIKGIGAHLENPEEIREKQRIYLEEQVKREKIQKIRFLLEKILHRFFRIDALTVENLDDIISILTPPSELK